jgi:hypothetical protein
VFSLAATSPGTTAQIIQIIGALLVLGGFAGTQYGFFHPTAACTCS